MHAERKPPVFASKPLAFALERISKATLIDLVIDLARTELGRSNQVADSAIIAQVEAWLDPVEKAREVRPVNLGGAYQTFVNASDRAIAARKAAGK